MISWFGAKRAPHKDYHLGKGNRLSTNEAVVDPQWSKCVNTWSDKSTEFSEFHCQFRSLESFRTENE